MESRIFGNEQGFHGAPGEFLFPIAAAGDGESGNGVYFPVFFNP